MNKKILGTILVFGIFFCMTACSLNELKNLENLKLKESCGEEDDNDSKNEKDTDGKKEHDNNESESENSAELESEKSEEEETDKTTPSFIEKKEFAEASPNDSYKNIAVFCVDSVTGELYGSTKSKGIMVLSINERTKEVKLANVQHLTYWNIDGEDTYAQAWLAYNDGPAAAITALNINLDLAITDYITIGFDGMEQLAENVGGVEAYIDADEMNMMNENTVKYLPDEMEDNLASIEKTGLQTLDSIQTVAYFMGNLRTLGGFMVVERQQEIVENLVIKLMSMDDEYVNYIFDDLYTKNIATSLDKKDYLDLVSQVLDSGISKMYCFPAKELAEPKVIGAKGSCLCPVDLSQNAIEMHRFLFNDNEYQPTQSLQEYSLEIQKIISAY